jgi:branched-chain amino acid transport system permease protein
MGVSDTYTRGRRVVVEQPMAVVVGVVGVLVLLDLVRQVATGAMAVS